MTEATAVSAAWVRSMEGFAPPLPPPYKRRSARYIGRDPGHTRFEPPDLMVDFDAFDGGPGRE